MSSSGQESYLIVYVCPCKSCFNAYVLPNLEHCASVWMSSAESHLSLLDRVVRSAERLCEDELCCLRHRRRSVPCVCYIRFIT